MSKRKKKHSATASPMEYKVNPSVRIESVDNGMVLTDARGNTKIAKDFKESLKLAKGMLKVG